MSLTPSLGILITYYNEGTVLTDCLRSLLKQSPAPSEILVYDDCSSLPPGNFIPTGMSVKVVRGEKNVGPGIGRNRLLEVTQSDFIHFHDADDLFEEGWTAAIFQGISEGYEAIFTEISRYNEKGEQEYARIQDLRPFETQDEMLAFCLQGAILTSAGTYATPRVRQIGGYRESLWQSEDYDFHIRLIASGVKFLVIEEPLVRRVSEAGRSAVRSEVWESAMQALLALAEELPSKYHGEIAEAAARIGSNLYGLNSFEWANKGFDLAHRLGPAKYRHRGPAYGMLCRLMGQRRTEAMASGYRSVFPKWIRRALKG